MASNNPDQIGTIWINEGVGKGAGKLFFGGRVFDIGHGVTVDLIPFKSEKDGVTRRGWNVVKIADIDPQGDKPDDQK